MVFLTDQTVGSSGVLTMKRPNGTTAYTTPFISTNAYNASYWWWSFGPSSFDAYGTWTLSFAYNGNVVEHAFVYGSDLGIGNLEHEGGISFYPNPATSTITFSAAIAALDVYQTDGKKLQVSHTATTADISALPNGVFILRGIDASGKMFIAKLTK
jgi:hypothetical protein